MKSEKTDGHSAVTDLDTAPFSPRFSFRHSRGDEDVPAMLAVHDACRDRDRTDPYSVCTSLPNLGTEDYAQRVREAPPQATLLAEEDGTVVAHAWMDAWGIEERLYLWHVWVMPRCRGLGLGTAMHRWGEVRARALHGDDPRPALYLANATDGEEDAVALLRHEGYYLSFVSPELAFDAFDSLPPVPVVAGIDLRPLEPSAHRAVARALCEANLNSPGQEEKWSDDALERRIDLEEEEWREHVRSADPALSPVAWDGDAVAGAYLCRRKARVGEIAQVAVRAPWRGCGVARALSTWSLHGLKAAGCVTARLFTSTGPDDVEPTEGPYAMYRKFGFVPIAHHLRFRKAMSL